MITSPPELYTALTDLLTVPFAVYFAVKCIALFKKTSRMGVLIFSALFGAMALSSFIGFIAHFFKFSDSVKGVLWVPLSFLMCVTSTLLCMQASSELFDKKHIKKITVFMTSVCILGFAAMMIGKAMNIKYILIFVFYAVFVVSAGLIMYIITLVKYKKRYILYYFCGCAVQALGAVFQITRDVYINIGIEIDYNSIYHVLNIISLFPFYIGALRSARGQE